MKLLPVVTDSHMSKGSLSTKNMVAAKPKSKVVSCSTPELQADSPSRDSDSVCDSEAASPVPFFCTQDGAEGETDVVWNYYAPKAEHTATSRIKNSTPLTRKRKASKPKLINRPTPKRKLVHKVSHKKAELFQELVELNQNLDELISKKKTDEVEDKQSEGEEDLFSDLSGQSPKSCFKTNSRCLRKNLLSSKFAKPEVDTALESDDSMNECLIKASQVIEENILKTTPAKKSRFEPNRSRGHKTSVNFQMDQDSMDAILNSIKLESPFVTRTKKSDSPCLNNDSFDNLVGNLNDSALDRLTQVPLKDSYKSKVNNSKGMDWLVDDIVLHEDSMSKSFFGRHNSMPESPSVNHNKPSTSGMVITRYSSMPHDKNTELSDSPIRCTPDEIKRKHQQAREKLLAKRQLPFTSSQLSQVATQVQPAMHQKRAQISQMATQPQPALEPKKTQFQPKVASAAKITPSLQSSVTSSANKIPPKVANNVPNSLNKAKNATNCFQPNSNIDSIVNDKSKDLKLLIEKKRQEALMKLRRRQTQK